MGISEIEPAISGIKEFLYSDGNGSGYGHGNGNGNGYGINESTIILYIWLTIFQPL